MGELIEFQKAKDRILGTGVVVSPTSPEELNRAIEKFSFSKLPKRERIAQILVQALSAQATFGSSADAIPYVLKIAGEVDFLAVADLIDKYAVGNFADPFECQMFQYDAEPEAAE